MERTLKVQNIPQKILKPRLHVGAKNIDVLFKRGKEKEKGKKEIEKEKRKK